MALFSTRCNDVSSLSQAHHYVGNLASGKAEEKAVTSKGAQMMIESLSLRVFEIDEAKAKLDKEKESLQARIRELEQIRDTVTPTPIINIG